MKRYLQASVTPKKSAQGSNWAVMPVAAGAAWGKIHFADAHYRRDIAAKAF